jgi:MFS family permease
MISLCTEYYQFFLAQGLVLGLCMSFLFTPALATVSRYFVRHRGLALGITVAGSSMGGVIWPIMLDQLLNTHGLSFGWTMRIVGFTMLPLVVIATLTIRSPSKVPPQDWTNAGVAEESKGHKTDLSIAKSFTFQLMCAGLAIGSLGLLSPFFYVSSYATSLGTSASISFYLVSVVNGASLFGRVLPGFLADRFGCFNLCSLAIFASAVTAFCWTKATNIAGLVVWSLAYGFASGVSNLKLSGLSIGRSVLTSNKGHHESTISLCRAAFHSRNPRNRSRISDVFFFTDVSCSSRPFWDVRC